MASCNLIWATAAILVVPAVSYTLTLKGFDVESAYQDDDISAKLIDTAEKGLVEEINIALCGKLCVNSADIVQRTSRALKRDGKDPYFMKSTTFTIPISVLNGIRDIRVTLVDSQLFGLSEFRSLSESKLLEKDLHDLWFVWNYLRVVHKVVIARDDHRVEGEAHLKYEDLVMHAKFRASDPEAVEIEMSRVHRVKITLVGFRMDKDVERIISEEIKSKTETILNENVRDILSSYMKGSLLKTAGIPELPSSKIISPGYNFVRTN